MADAKAEWDLVPQMQVSLSVFQHILLDVGEFDAPVHGELSGGGIEGCVEAVLIEVLDFGRELDAHEEEAEFDVLMLVGVEDVDVVVLDEEGHDRGDDAFAVGTVDEEGGGSGGGHGDLARIRRLTQIT